METALSLTETMQSLLSEFAPGHVIQNVPPSKLPSWWIQHHVMWATYTPVNAEGTLWKLMMNIRLRVYSPRTGNLANVSADSLAMRAHSYIQKCAEVGKEISGVVLKGYTLTQTPNTEFSVATVTTVAGEQSDSTLTLTAFASRDTLFGAPNMEEPSKALQELGVL